MESDGLAIRRDYGENPPRVEYGLTELRRQMMSVIDSLASLARITRRLWSDARWSGLRAHAEAVRRFVYPQTPRNSL